MDEIDSIFKTRLYFVSRIIMKQLIQDYHQYGVVLRPALYIKKKGALDSQPQVIKFTSCLPMVGGSLRIPPPLKLVTMI
jgi:hypothetical protein